MIKTALTGNYGMGKSSVLAEFGALGAYTISTDAIVADLLKDAAILDRVRIILGPLAFRDDGSLDKAMAARIIFMDALRRREHEALLHPFVFQRIEEELESANPDIAIIEIPLLYELRCAKSFDRVITVYADLATVVERMKARGIKRDDVLLRQSAQMDIQDKVDRAHFVIDNNGSSDATRKRIGEIYAALLALSRGNGPARA